MKNKTSLVLIEQLLMILVFAMAAAICLKAFAYSSNVSSKNEAVSQAAVIAQNCAERLKKSHGEDDAGFWTQVGEWKYRAKIQRKESETEGLGCAQIIVFGECKDREEQLFELSVAWQEVSNDE